MKSKVEEVIVAKKSINVGELNWIGVDIGILWFLANVVGGRFNRVWSLDFYYFCLFGTSFIEFLVAL